MVIFKNIIKKKKDEFRTSRASILILVMVATTVFIILGNVALQYVINQSKLAQRKTDKEIAFQIAEAGINYYRWHLAHVTDDFQDGTGTAGPYLHDYVNLDGNVIGQFSLNIIPPLVGSTEVTILSTGCLGTCAKANPTLNKTITLKMAKPSFASYASVSNAGLFFSENTEVWGPVHSNDEVKFNGVAHNKVTAVNNVSTQCTLPPYCACPPPFEDTACELCPKGPCRRSVEDVFWAGYEYPVAEVDFNRITVDLAKAKTESQNGIYLGPSEREGYHVNFNDNGTVDLTKVTKQKDCQYDDKKYQNTYSIDAESAFEYEGGDSLNLPLPSNGLIFLQDDVWVDGTVDGKVTVIAAKEPLASAKANIFINNDLIYKNDDGSDAVGLLAQQDIIVGFYSEDDLEIDGALMSQKGRLKREYYAPNVGSIFVPGGCGDYVNRQLITIQGSVATSYKYGFSYDDGTGYAQIKFIFDNNLVYSPPPSYPTTGEYSIISWEVN